MAAWGQDDDRLNHRKDWKSREKIKIQKRKFEHLC